MKYLEQLENLVQRYFNESHHIYKFVDADGDPLKLAFHFESRFDYLNKYLAFYKGLNSLSEVITFACSARFKLEEDGDVHEITHPHQQYFIARDNKPRGIEASIMRLVGSKVQSKMTTIEKAVSFEDIMKIVDKEKVRGFGSLAIYDSSVRIAAYLNITPDRVYLHAGSKEGAKHLESKGLVPGGSSANESIPMADMPKPFQRLHPTQVENLLCSFKSAIEKLEE